MLMQSAARGSRDEVIAGDMADQAAIDQIRPLAIWGWTKPLPDRPYSGLWTTTDAKGILAGPDVEPTPYLKRCLNRCP